MSDLEVIKWEYEMLMKNKLALELVNKNLDYEDENRLKQVRKAYDIFKPRLIVEEPKSIKKEEIPF